MLNKKLINPESIAVIGASNNTGTPGGGVLKNLIETNYQGKLYAVNRKETAVQGIKCYRDVADLPQTDTAIIAVSARFVLEIVKVLAHSKNTKGFIIVSAGFSEMDARGKKLEQEVTAVIDSVGGSLLGPNNIGLINQNYAGVFTSPIPILNPKGVDFISGSGATAVFIMEAAMELGLTFSSLYTVGNSAQLGVEDILEYFDLTFDPIKSSRIKILYLEHVKNPDKLLIHARSLIKKGCKIAAIKAGYSDAGIRAASSHTGALVTSDAAVAALFKKAGIVRCHGRNELVTLASVWTLPEFKGKNIAIITHAGGPAVMLTDSLSQNGFIVPPITGQKADDLEAQLFPGSSVSNPIDIMATGTAEQLGIIIDYCNDYFDEIDAMVVIHGSPGLSSVADVFDMIHEKMQTSKKPIFPVLPSLQNARNEIKEFVAKDHVFFPDEVLFGNALERAYTVQQNGCMTKESGFNVDETSIRQMLQDVSSGYLSPNKVNQLLTAVGIPTIPEYVCSTESELLNAVNKITYPAVLKAVGPIHKSDVGGIILNIDGENALKKAFKKIMEIPGTTAALLQPMTKGIELFVGAKRELPFGHLVLFGSGGIYVEVLKDVKTCLAPVTVDEALEEIVDLKLYKLLKGVRNQPGIPIGQFAEIVQKVSLLVGIIPEIIEMDLNPLIGNGRGISCVDARIRIEL